VLGCVPEPSSGALTSGATPLDSTHERDLIKLVRAARSRLLASIEGSSHWSSQRVGGAKLVAHPSDPYGRAPNLAPSAKAFSGRAVVPSGSAPCMSLCRVL